MDLQFGGSATVAEAGANIRLANDQAKLAHSFFGIGRIGPMGQASQGDFFIFDFRENALQL